MSVSAKWAMTVNTTETVTANPALTTAKSSDVYGEFDSSGTLNSGSTPPATTCAYFSKALSSGAATIDLTSLTHGNETRDFTGLKVQLAHFENPSANANSITVTFGASNGYLLAGTAWKVILAPGQEVMFQLNDAAPDVDGTHKTIDLAGTGSQTLNVSLVAG